MSIVIIKTVVLAVVGIAFGILAGNGAVYAFNHVPAKWLCDYNQEPGEELLREDTQRVKSYPWKAVFSMVFVLLGIFLFTRDSFYAIPAMLACWLLLLIAIADKKYMIIPDQFIFLLLLTGIGFVPYMGSIKSMLLGALIGGGCMLVVSVAGKLIFKKEVMGFGDVKLFAAIGLITGAYEVIFILIATSLLSCIAYGILLLMKKNKKGQYQPLGIYIAMVTAVCLILGKETMETVLYFALFS